MATRFNPGSKSNNGQLPLPTGYETTQGSVDLYLPPCGVEDVDVALFNLFEKEISPFCGGNDSSPLKKIPVIFAAGEKWSLLKNGRPLRDRNNTLLLPLLTIMRTELAQSPSEEMTARGINQSVGEITVNRRLHKSDRDYQNLINKFFLKDQENLAVSTHVSSSQLTTDRRLGELSDTKDAMNGKLLQPYLNNNIVETIVVPTPQFYTAKYQITIWTQYMQHANQIMEKVITSFLPQVQGWKLETPKGYWFVASVDGGSYALENNFDDMSQQERFIKYSFNVNVPAYFFVSQTPGSPIPIKRYISSPIIKFESLTASPSVVADQDPNSIDDQYELGTDDPTLPMEIHPKRPKLFPRDNLSIFGSNYRVRSASSNGETVYSKNNYSLGDLEIELTNVFPGDSKE